MVRGKSVVGLPVFPPVTSAVTSAWDSEFAATCSRSPPQPDRHGPVTGRKENGETLPMLETYGSAGLLVAAVLAIAKLLVSRGFRLTFKAEVPTRRARSD
jgi:hypothetical protein